MAASLRAMETVVGSGARPAVAPVGVGSRRAMLGAGAIVLWAALIAGSWVWGDELNESGARLRIDAPPLLGHWKVELGWRVLPALAVAAVTIAAAPLARSIRWPALLTASVLGSAAWAVALAFTEGWAGLVDPLTRSNEYLAALPQIDAQSGFLADFTERIGSYPIHVRGHPPGLLLALLGLDSVGLAEPWPLAIAIIAVAASAAAAVLITARGLAGEAAARRAAPFLVLVPGAVWIATTADALVMGIGSWAVAGCVLAITQAGRRSDLLAIAGGLLFAPAAMLSYGAVLLGLIPLAAAAARRRYRPVALAAVAFGGVMLAIWAAGFSWVDGYFATHEQYLASNQQNRPYDFFLLNNLGAFALAAGPAAAVGIALLRDRPAWLLVGGAAAAITVANLSGMSKGEVERIWLPFLPWTLLATSSLQATPRVVGGLLAAQVALGIAIQTGIEVPW